MCECLYTIERDNKEGGMEIDDFLVFLCKDIGMHGNPTDAQMVPIMTYQSILGFPV